MNVLQKSARTYPPISRETIVVWGLLGAYPFGGMTWQGLHYLVGLRRLGFDVWYVEDSRITLLDPDRNWPTQDSGPNVQYLERFMRQIGFEHRWVFRPPAEGDACYGALDLRELAHLYQRASAVFNVCGAHAVRAEHEDIKCLVYLQTDPGADQVLASGGDKNRQALLDAHHYHFTYAENIQAPDCLLPKDRYHWLTTRPPVVLDWWATTAPPLNRTLTTITNWKPDFGKDVNFEGVKWRWNKQDEIRRFVDLPARSKLALGMAISAIDDEDWKALVSRGWHLTRATELSDPFRYRRFIRQSMGEFTVAKEQYTLPRTGWFSDRSVCYLAAGRPVIAQDTSFDAHIPTGEGLFSYREERAILEAIDAIASDYGRHSEGARQIAADFFDATKVLDAMMRQLGLV